MHAPLPLLIAGVTATTGVGIGSIAINTGALDDIAQMLNGTTTVSDVVLAEGVTPAPPTKTSGRTKRVSSVPVGGTVSAVPSGNTAESTPGTPSVDPTTPPVTTPQPPSNTGGGNHGSSGGSSVSGGGSGGGDDEGDDDRNESEHGDQQGGEHEEDD